MFNSGKAIFTDGNAEDTSGGFIAPNRDREKPAARGKGSSRNSEAFGNTISQLELIEKSGY
jgi:hypothetical protein